MDGRKKNCRLATSHQQDQLRKKTTIHREYALQVLDNPVKPWHCVFLGMASGSMSSVSDDTSFDLEVEERELLGDLMEVSVQEPLLVCK